MAAPSKSSMANTRAPTSASACRFCRSRSHRVTSAARGTRRMRHKPIAGLCAAVLLAAITGCGATLPRSRDSQSLPLIDRNSTETTVLAGYLDTCLRLAPGTPAEQAEILTTANNEYNAAPTPSRVLRYAMVLSTPGHAGFDPV